VLHTFEPNPYSAAHIPLDNLLNTTNSEIRLVEPMKIKWKFLYCQLLAAVPTINVPFVDRNIFCPFVNNPAARSHWRRQQNRTEQYNIINSPQVQYWQKVTTVNSWLLDFNSLCPSSTPSPSKHKRNISNPECRLFPNSLKQFNRINILPCHLAVLCGSGWHWVHPDAEIQFNKERTAS
jgi:hypothetical protein